MNIHQRLLLSLLFADNATSETERGIFGAHNNAKHTHAQVRVFVCRDARNGSQLISELTERVRDRAQREIFRCHTCERGPCCV